MQSGAHDYFSSFPGHPQRCIANYITIAHHMGTVLILANNTVVAFQKQIKSTIRVDQMNIVLATLFKSGVTTSLGAMYPP